MADANDDLDAIARELLGAPLDEFIANRNARVRELRTSGQAELAAQIAQLRRPVVALWAANQLAHHPDALERVRAATTAATEAQARGAADDLRAATVQLRQALDDIARTAATLLSEAGHAATDDVTQRIREMVRVAALGETDWARLASGALLQPPEANAGLGGAPSGVAKPSKPAATSKAAPARPARDTAADARAAREARQQAGIDARAAEEAAKRAKRLREQADELSERAEAAGHEAEEAAATAQERASASQAELDRLTTGND